MKTPQLKPISSLMKNQGGQMTVEWSLLIAAFGLPMIFLFSVLLATLAEHYRMLTLVLTLPFP